MSGPGWDERSRPSSGPWAPPSGSPAYPGYPTGGLGAGGGGPRPYGAPWGGPSFPAADSVGAGGDTAPPVQAGTPHRRRRTTLIAAATVAFALAAGFAGGAFGARLTSGTSAIGSATLTQLSTAAVSASRAAAPAGSVEQVAATLLPSVVSILSASSSMLIVQQCG